MPDAQYYAQAMTGRSAQLNAKEWDKYMKDLGKLIEESSGFERKELKKKYQDARENRDNAYRIAEMQYNTQRDIADERLDFEQNKWGDEYANQIAAMTGRMADGTVTLDRDKFEKQYQLERDKWAQQYELDLRKQGFTEEQARWERQNKEQEFRQEFELKQGIALGRINGQMTDASREWQARLGLDAAKIAADLSQNPGDVFKLASFYNQAGQQGALGSAANILGSTLSSGRGQAEGPGTQSMDGVLTQLGAPPPYSPQAQGGALPLGVPMALQSQGPLYGMPRPQGMDTDGLVRTADMPSLYGPKNGRLPNAAASGMGPDGPLYAQTQASLPAYQSAAQLPTARMASVQSPGYAPPTGVQPGTYQQPLPRALTPPSYTPTPPAQSSLMQQTNAFADEAFKLARDANQWAPGQWESYTPTTQSLLKGAWKSKGLNPDDVLFKNSVSGLGNEDSGRSA